MAVRSQAPEPLLPAWGGVGEGAEAEGYRATERNWRLLAKTGHGDGNSDSNVAVIRGDSVGSKSWKGAGVANA